MIIANIVPITLLARICILSRFLRSLHNADYKNISFWDLDVVQFPTSCDVSDVRAILDYPIIGFSNLFLRFLVIIITQDHKVWTIKQNI